MRGSASRAWPKSGVAAGARAPHGTRVRTITLVPALAAALVVSAGCAHEPRAPGAIDVTVHAADRVNPDETGHSLPTLVRVYQLKGQGAIEAADYAAVYGGDRETLGPDLLQVDEIVVPPGGTVERRVTRADGAAVLAAVAILRRPSGSDWRSVVELPRGGDPARFAFQVEDYRIARR